MSDLHDMMARWAQPGVVTWIGVRPARAADILVLDRATLTENGIEGDRGRKGKRAVTLVQAEHLPVIASCLGRDAIDPTVLRRNIVVRGLNLNGLKGREVQHDYLAPFSLRKVAAKSAIRLGVSHPYGGCQLAANDLLSLICNDQTQRAIKRLAA